MDLKFLSQYPEFNEFRYGSKLNGHIEENNTIHSDEDIEQTPEEELESLYQRIRRTLADELLDRMKQSSSQFFEQLVVDLLIAMGYGGSVKDAGRALQTTGDDGIDGTIKEDKLGLEVIYVQAKKWDSSPVGRPIVQAFAGSLEGQRAKKGVLITTSRFSNEAKEYVNRIEKKIVLIDGEELAQLMIDYEVGVTVKETYVVKRLDEGYFSGE